MQYHHIGDLENAVTVKNFFYHRIGGLSQSAVNTVLFYACHT